MRNDYEKSNNLNYKQYYITTLLLSILSFTKSEKFGHLLILNQDDDDFDFDVEKFGDCCRSYKRQGDTSKMNA